MLFLLCLLFNASSSDSFIFFCVFGTKVCLRVWIDKIHAKCVLVFVEPEFTGAARLGIPVKVKLHFCLWYYVLTFRNLLYDRSFYVERME